MQERLQKIIAQAGIASRRKAEEMILEGRVTVNRKAATKLGTKADPEKDRIAVDGRVISAGADLKSVPKIYILLNKPKGVISTVSDPEGRPTVIDLVKKLGTDFKSVPRLRLFPIGRLDLDAEGVLLLTNDGELANKLIHPRYKIPKKYLVKVSDAPDDKDIAKLKKGIYLEDGRTLPAEAKFIKATKTNSWIELTVYEGRNRLVKRMCFAIGHSVLKLQRTEFAGIKLGSLKPGDFRMLTAGEVKKLKGWTEP
ncbi:MAG: pseudouridine synthase [Deltaproteobacteria bacterium RIFCSPLOWO2_12_FULL_43_16]|nr:MAG: pseudouridine synthase [Deltaproteobacteria bacterium GWA2_43_19]OGQ09647.1 MAG: pseudouridine synthase [Deltaproteobacteria bacterium RIFCSPHIGHO2_02_FULL_43_33]OGQ43832.1 MAG: pseudouridine synthase [Deltaproteobacteria bacterium RIFCSPLOWO2_01_FULL_42_9]OGQ57479.1 MAG: pseudouridine synthase [Deltaproteobacteria bacterium RIFCSPLOWO2_12_FULL_43_16]HBR17497.1 pseudouridine synthase [Deltaproteobacteria bacterium]